jgi:hypothetical protein
MFMIKPMTSLTEPEKRPLKARKKSAVMLLTEQNMLPEKHTKAANGWLFQPGTAANGLPKRFGSEPRKPVQQ